MSRGISRKDPCRTAFKNWFNMIFNETGLSARTFASLIGVSNKVVTSYNIGQNMPTFATFSNICELYNLNPVITAHALGFPDYKQIDRDYPKYQESPSYILTKAIAFGTEEEAKKKAAYLVAKANGKVTQDVQPKAIDPKPKKTKAPVVEEPHENHAKVIATSTSEFFLKTCSALAELFNECDTNIRIEEDTLWVDIYTTSGYVINEKYTPTDLAGFFGSDILNKIRVMNSIVKGGIHDQD